VLGLNISLENIFDVLHKRPDFHVSSSKFHVRSFRNGISASEFEHLIEVQEIGE
jgi:hypothetical protein